MERLSQGRVASMKRKEKPKLVKSFFVFTSTDREKKKVRAIRRYTSSAPTSAPTAGRVPLSQEAKQEEEDVEESSIALLCLPDGILVKESPAEPRFHSFVITKQNGSRVYGSALIVWELASPSPLEAQVEGQHNDHDKDQPTSEATKKPIYVTKALCFLTSIPFVVAMKCLLFYLWRNDCEPALIQRICNLKMPSKGKCLKLILPQVKDTPTNGNLPGSSTNGMRNGRDSLVSGEPPEIFIYRGISEFPLFDYPLRELFSKILSPDQFLIAFTATLLEYQILVVSKDYYKLMLVSEALTSLLLPFKWQHVYVPILPSKLGLHYLDAPTPYIMGINPSNSSQSLPSSSSSFTHSIQCRVNCDSNKVEYSVTESNGGVKEEALPMPPFMSELKAELDTVLVSDLRLTTQSSPIVNRNQSEALKRVTEIARKHKVIKEDFTYLDDLKLNQSLRIACMRTLKKYILTDYEKFIVNAHSKKEPIKFDVVSYLCDQPDSLRPFLTKFLETQMFASFIDDTAKRIQRSKQSLYSSNQSLMSTSTTAPESLDECDELALFNDLLLETRFGSAQEVDLRNELTAAQDTKRRDSHHVSAQSRLMGSPIKQRHLRSRTPVSEKVTLSDNSVNSATPSPLPNEQVNDIMNQSLTESQLLASPVRVPSALAAHTNWRVVESLLREAKVKTKRILLEKMGNEEIAPLGCGSVGELEENTLFASLCDLVERVWSHGRANEAETNNNCAFWSHLVAFSHYEASDDVNQPNFDSNFLTPALSQISLDSSSSPSYSTSTPSSPSRQANNNNYQHLKPLPTTLLHDFRSIQSMTDVKTDIGKSRAFIRLALERKLLSKHLRTLLMSQHLLVSMYKRYAFIRCEEEREQFITHLLTLNAVDLLCFTNTFTTSSLTYKLFVYGSGPLSGWISLSGTISSSSEISLQNGSKMSGSDNVFTFKHRNLGLVTTLTVSVAQTSKLFIEFFFLRNEVTGHTYKFLCQRWFGRNIDDGATERVLIGEMVVNTTVGEIIKKSREGRSSSIGRHWSRTGDSGVKEDLDAEELQQLLGENVNNMVRYYYNNCSDQEANPGAVSREEEVVEEMSSSPPKTGSGGRKISPKQRNNLILEPLNKPFPATLCHPLKQPLRGSVSSGQVQHQKLNHLLMGEKQLLWTLQHIFYFGFKNRGRSSFRKQVFLWDYILRIQVELKLSSGKTNPSPDAVHSPVQSSLGTGKSWARDKFIELVETISAKAPNWGKEGKFQLFLLLSLRDHLLGPHFLRLLCRPAALCQQFYESHSFLRELTLLTFLKQILISFSEMQVLVEPSLTKGL